MERTESIVGTMMSANGIVGLSVNSGTVAIQPTHSTVWMVKSKMRPSAGISTLSAHPVSERSSR